MQLSHFSLTTSEVQSAARCLCHQTPCSRSVPHFSGSVCSPRQQKVSQSSSAACSSDRAWICHPPLAPWCEAKVVWPAGPGGRTGSCPERKACGFPGAATLTGTAENRFVSVFARRDKQKKKGQLHAAFTFLKRDQQEKDALRYDIRVILLQLLQQPNEQLFGSTHLKAQEHRQIAMLTKAMLDSLVNNSVINQFWSISFWNKN